LSLRDEVFFLVHAAILVQCKRLKSSEFRMDRAVCHGPQTEARAEWREPIHACSSGNLERNSRTAVSLPYNRAFPGSRSGCDFESSEGVRIFTVNRESGSSLTSKTKPMRPRLSRSRIASAVAAVAFVVALPSLPAQTPAQTLPATGIQTLCQPQVIGNRRIPKESVLARLFSHQGDRTR